MRVIWTRPALADVLGIKEYIASDSPWFAQLVAERLFSAVERLNNYPLSGRMVPELNEPTIREVIEPPFRIVYRVRADTLEILTVVHFRAAVSDQHVQRPWLGEDCDLRSRTCVAADKRSTDGSLRSPPLIRLQ